MTPSRQPGMYHETYIVMWLLMAIAFIIFGKGVYDRYKLWKLGVPEDRKDTASFSRFIKNSFGHVRLLNDPYPGIMHFLIFWGFVVLAIGTASIALEEDLHIPIFNGSYYLIVSLALDIFGLGAVIGISIASWRRYVTKPDRLDNKPEDGITLGLILAILLTGFLLEGFRIAFTNDPWANWTPVGSFVALIFYGANPDILKAVHPVIWWSMPC